MAHSGAGNGRPREACVLLLANKHFRQKEDAGDAKADSRPRTKAEKTLSARLSGSRRERRQMKLRSVPTRLGLGEGFDGRLVLQDVPLGRGQDMQDLVLDLLQGTLVLSPRKNELVLLLL